MLRGRDTLYKMVREGKNTFVKVEPGKNNKVIIRIPYNENLIKKVKTISGRRWNTKGKCWEVSYKENIIQRIQNLFGENLDIDPYFLPYTFTEGTFNKEIFKKDNSVLYEI